MFSYRKRISILLFLLVINTHTSVEDVESFKSIDTIFDLKIAMDNIYNSDLLSENCIEVDMLVDYVLGCSSKSAYDLDMVSTLKKNHLNILFVVGHFPSLSQIFILNMITGLIDKGHNVTIFSFHKDHYTFVHPNIKKYQLLDKIIYKNFPSQLADYDIVFCQFGYLGNKILDLPQMKQWLKQGKLAVCFRGSDTTKYVKNDPHVYRKLFEKGHLFLPVCDYFKKRLIKLGCKPTKIMVHHSGIDCTQFFFRVRKTPEDGIIHLITTCRLVKKKGVEYAIKAIARVVKNYSNICFTIIGDGPERAHLKTLIKQLDLQDKVSLQGWVPHEKVVSFLNKAHIFLLPSIRSSDGNEEGIPNALKEAMAMGLISIATWHAGNPELIDHEISGFLVPEKNVAVLAHTIEYVIEHPEQWSSIGLAARKKVEEQFETKSLSIELEEMLLGLLDRDNGKMSSL